MAFGAAVGYFIYEFSAFNDYLDGATGLGAAFIASQAGDDTLSILMYVWENGAAASYVKMTGIGWFLVILVQIIVNNQNKSAKAN